MLSITSHIYNHAKVLGNIKELAQETALAVIPVKSSIASVKVSWPG